MLAIRLFHVAIYSFQDQDKQCARE